MTALKKIRIGTDVITALSVNISGKPVTWSEGDIRHVYAFSDVQGQPVAEMAHKAEGQTLRCTYAAKDQNYTGPFRVIVEFADGKAFSSSLDVPAGEHQRLRTLHLQRSVTLLLLPPRRQDREGRGTHLAGSSLTHSAAGGASGRHVIFVLN